MNLRIAAAALFVLFSADAASAALAPGDPAPDFSVDGSQDGAIVQVELSMLLKSGPVVLYFFPSAYTDPVESREFAEKIGEFHAAGASVLGMSRDSIDTLKRFSVEQCMGKYAVGSADRTIVDAYDVNDGAMFNTRTTYVIAPGGKIVFVDNDMEPTGHARAALAFVKGMKR